MTRPATAALLAAALTTGTATSAASTDLLTDLNVSGSVEASAFDRIETPGEAPDFEPTRDEDSDRDEASADGFAGFPLSVAASAGPRVSSTGPNRSRGGASLSAERGFNAVSVEGSASDDGGFSSNSGFVDSGTGRGLASFRYGFNVEEAVSWLLVFSEEVTANQGGGFVGADAFLVDLATGDAVVPAFVEEDLARFDPTTTSSGTLLPGSYQLAFEVASEASEVGGISANAVFSVAFNDAGGPPTPIPSPAALPAGLAVLGGFLARRRR